MSDKSNMVAHARKFAQQFSGLLQLADWAEEIGSVERAAKEAQARLEKLQAEEAAVLKAREQQAVLMVKEIEAACADKKSRADEYLAGMRARAEKLLDNATEAADKKLRAAADELHKLIVEKQDMEAKIAQLVESFNRHQASVDAKVLELNQLEYKVSKAHEKHAEVTSTLEKLRSSLA